MLVRLILFIFIVFNIVFVSSLQAQMQKPKPQPPVEEPGPLSFFITSVGLGDGGNLGGLEGADAHCQSLATAVGAGDRTWHAYLSTHPKDGKPGVDAKDRIGQGPWYNAEGLRIAESLDALIYDNSGLNYETALNEKGGKIGSLSMGDEHNQKDIMTGSALDGTVMQAKVDATCHNWTSNDEGTAQSGHHDRFRWFVWGSSWNSAHPSKGCSQEALNSTGGDGLFYCFAID